MMQVEVKLFLISFYDTVKHIKGHTKNLTWIISITAFVASTSPTSNQTILFYLIFDLKNSSKIENGKMCRPITSEMKNKYNERQIEISRATEVMRRQQNMRTSSSSTSWSSSTSSRSTNGNSNHRLSSVLSNIINTEQNQRLRMQ